MVDWLLRVVAGVAVAGTERRRRRRSDSEAGADWSAAAQNKDVEKSVSFYAEDGVLLPNKGAIAKGKAQTREFWAHLLSLPGVKVSFAPTKIEVAKSKDMAYDVGTYEFDHQRCARQSHHRDRKVRGGVEETTRQAMEGGRGHLQSRQMRM
jgi:ketosteroid isomerase-like protein